MIISYVLLNKYLNSILQMMLILILLTVVTATIVYKIWAYNKYWKHVMKMPGPKSLPIVGNFLISMNSEELFQYDRWRGKHLYPIHKLWSLGTYFISVLNPEDMELVLSNSVHNNKSMLYKFLHGWLGSGLLTSNGSKWHNRRKILTPAFHFSILQQFIEVFNKETEILTIELLKHSEDDYVNVVKPITEFTLYSIGETSLGINLRERNCGSYKDAIYQYGHELADRIKKPHLFNDFLFSMTSSYRKLKEVVKILHDFSTKIIQEREKTKKLNTDGSYSYSKRKKLALLDLMLEAKASGEDISNEGIREEVDTFMFEGHDTTSVALCYMLVTLANEPKYQDEIYDEILAIVGKNQYPSYQELTDLKFMERCIKECLRLYPSVPFISRVAGEEIQTHTGYTIPKGSTVNMYIYDLHHSPEVWEDPEKFDPDRFLPENTAGRNPFAYLPFSAGGRNCIGQKFAILEMKAAICGILRKFKLVAVDKREDLRFKIDLVLRPVGEIRVKFVPRHI